MENRVKKTLIGSLMFGGLALLGACGGDSGTSDSSQSSQGASAGSDTLYIGLTNAPGGFNAVNATDTVSSYMSRLMYPTLLDQPESLVFEPNLAEEFETEDNQVYSITLRDDAKWSDGEAITAEDVAYTLEVIANPVVESSLVSYTAMIEGVGDNGKLSDGETSISGVDIIDDTHLTITLKAPRDVEYISEMIGFNIFIIPKHSVEEYELADLANSEFATSPKVTGGAYTFVAYENNSYVQLAGNENYYKGKPILENLYLKIMNGTNLVTELQSGGVDMAAGGGIGVIPVSDVETLSSNADLIVEGYPSFATQYLYVNNDGFDADVRLAMTYAIDREALVNQLLNGDGEVLNTIYTSASSYYDTDLETIAYDPEKAKELLEESGFDMSTVIELTVPTGNETRQKSANLIEQNLEAVGFTVEQVTFDFVTALSNMRSGDYQLGLLGLPLNSSPSQMSYWGTGGSLNFSNTSDATLDDLMTRASLEVDESARHELYNEVQEYWRDNAFVVGLYADYHYKAQSKNLNGGVNEFWAGSLHDIESWTKDE